MTEHDDVHEPLAIETLELAFHPLVSHHRQCWRQIRARTYCHSQKNKSDNQIAYGASPQGESPPLPHRSSSSAESVALDHPQLSQRRRRDFQAPGNRERHLRALADWSKEQA